jgi:HSP20 family protein
MPVRPDPLKELLDLQERMNRLFDQTLGRERLEEPDAAHGTWVPVADVFEATDCYVVEVELPGLSRDDVEVQVQADELLVRGERRCCPGTRPEAFRRLERRQGPFARSFRFPEPVAADHVAAEFTDGLLRVSVPKLDPQRSLRVKVEPGH